MTDEEKAKEIAEYLNQPNGSNSLLQCHQAAMIMAEWKDKIFEKIIDAVIEKVNKYPDNAGFSKSSMIDTLIIIKKVIR